MLVTPATESADGRLSFALLFAWSRLHDGLDSNLRAGRLTDPEGPMARYAAILAATSAVAAVAAVASTEAQAQARVEVGVLTCTVRGGTGFIIGSTKDLRCRFNKPGRDEFYHGTISKFGLDIGVTKQSAIAWAVFAPTANLRPGSLNGNYGGVSAEATVGLGVGANALIGGSSKNIILQPLSVQAQQGLNIAAGVAALQLRADY
jgi:hypothetical protein